MSDWMDRNANRVGAIIGVLLTMGVCWVIIHMANLTAEIFR